MTIRPGDGTTRGLDRLGSTQVLDALRSVRDGRVLELGTTFGDDMPQGMREAFYGFRVTPYHTPRALTSRESPGFDFSMEVIAGSPHLGTHVDGLAHVACHGQVFGGHHVTDVYDDHGWRANGMEDVPPVIGRGVLLDVAHAKGVEHLPDGYEITPDDIGAASHAAGVAIGTGDCVLVRTGWYRAFYERDPDTYFASQPGVGPDAAILLYEQGMALLGTDTSGTEVIPHRDPERTTHAVMIVERGVHLIEIMDLEAIADEAIHEFLFICLPLRITGATGSWVRPVAVV